MLLSLTAATHVISKTSSYFPSCNLWSADKCLLVRPWVATYMDSRSSSSADPPTHRPLAVWTSIPLVITSSQTTVHKKRLQTYFDSASTTSQPKNHHQRCLRFINNCVTNTCITMYYKYANSSYKCLEELTAESTSSNHQHSTVISDEWQQLQHTHRHTVTDRQTHTNRQTVSITDTQQSFLVNGNSYNTGTDTLP